MKILSILLLLIFSTVAYLYAEESLTKIKVPGKYFLVQADDHAKETQYKGNCDTLVNDLTSCFDNPYLKLRAIYSWIAMNISYNFKYTISITNVDNILENKKASSTEYSFIMYKMCDLAGLECEIVKGWGKSTPEHLTLIDWSQPNHSWIAVRINDEWRYCDVSWGAGYTKEGRVESYKQQFSDDYFNMSAEDISLQHYPEEVKWQRENSLSKEDFEEMPLFYRNYFFLKIKGLNEQSKLLKKDITGKITISFKTTEKVHSLLVNGVQRAWPYKVEGDTYSITFCPREMKSIITVYVNKYPLVAYTYE